MDHTINSSGHIPAGIDIPRNRRSDWGKFRLDSARMRRDLECAWRGRSKLSAEASVALGLPSPLRSRKAWHLHCRSLPIDPSQPWRGVPANAESSKPKDRQLTAHSCCIWKRGDLSNHFSCTSPPLCCNRAEKAVVNSATKASFRVKSVLLGQGQRNLSRRQWLAGTPICGHLSCAGAPRRSRSAAGISRSECGL